MTRPRILRAVVAVVATSALLAGCGGYDDTTVPAPAASAIPSDAAVDEAPACENDGSQVRSYAPTGDVLDGANVRRIKARGRLIAGVAADSYLLGSRNPLEGVIEGFDIDMVEAIAEKIFDEPGHVELRVITPDQRLRLLQEGHETDANNIDIVARNMTINCSRWETIAFSAEYFRSGQKVLAGRDTGIKTVADLAGKRVCAPTGTTSIDNIKLLAPDAIPVTAANDSECLVKFQNGEADALSTDDTVLAGLAAQDPYAVVLDSDRLTEEPYGIGVNADETDLVELINETLEDMRADGRWQESYDRWLRPALGKGTQPQPVYGR